MQQEKYLLVHFINNLHMLTNQIPIEQQILDIFEGFRMAPTPVDQYEQVGKSLLADKIKTFTAIGKPIEFVMLGFPFKSTNKRDKVIGDIPDRAEYATLQNFKRFDNAIREVYPTGIKMQIVSDGLIFNDIMNVCDYTVDQYKEISVDYARNTPTVFYDMMDFYSPVLTRNSVRDKVVTQFGISEQQLEKEIMFNPDVNFLYRGMIRFMEEELATKTFPSKNQLTKEAKRMTRIMMVRNEAYSNLVKNNFGNSVRLSMHPSVNNGAKYSFQLIPGNTRHSAWHSALVYDKDNNMSTMHRKDADAAGYELVYVNGKPNHYRITL